LSWEGKVSPRGALFSLCRKFSLAFISLGRLDEVEDAVNINDKLNQTVKNKDEKIASLETRSVQ